MEYKSFLLVFLGSGIGGLIRFSISKFLGKFYPFFPLGTLTANLMGMFLIGLFSVWFIDKNLLTSPYREMILIGFLGGLTTFSSFGYESYLLFKAGNWELLLIYFLGNLFLGFSLFFVGRYLGDI
jgi:CrcB protein